MKENKGNKTHKEFLLSESLESGLKYFVYIHMYQDVFADPIEVYCDRELLVGDYLNFCDHEMSNEFESVYKTSIFKILKRQYSVQYKEMYLHVEPYNI